MTVKYLVHEHHLVQFFCFGPGVRTGNYSGHCNTGLSTRTEFCHDIPSRRPPERINRVLRNLCQSSLLQLDEDCRLTVGLIHLRSGIYRIYVDSS